MPASVASGKTKRSSSSRCLLRMAPKSLTETNRALTTFSSFGGLLYGYQQGVLGEVLIMSSFAREFPSIVNDSGRKGWLTSVLQLGGWVGSLSAGVFAEVFSRKHTLLVGALWVVLGSFLAAGAQTQVYLFLGRLFTGFGAGTLSAIGSVMSKEV